MTRSINTPLKKGDKVVVITGKDKGKTGEVTQVITKTDRLVVSGVNLVTRHNKASMTSEPGKVQKEMPIHMSNVMLADPKDGKPTRVGYKMEGDKKVRFAKRSGEVLAS
ncbi:MAG: 50S ribosomal protein L24 [Magnetococcales bacterium]|mgnify:CR=1 FL=1|nr:50S ribosomal protein L24 [Magnetococcales bacterium]PPR19713.1 MAG: 50S ribosomal protein L24 [Pseudomonadota bacterium]|tara:strand:+ start:202 stop:528 length:327 start_codon:yes stop_codon:yes gene_type:complete